MKRKTIHEQFCIFIGVWGYSPIVHVSCVLTVLYIYYLKSTLTSIVLKNELWFSRPSVYKGIYFTSLKRVKYNFKWNQQQFCQKSKDQWCIFIPVQNTYRHAKASGTCRTPLPPMPKKHTHNLKQSHLSASHRKSLLLD